MTKERTNPKSNPIQTPKTNPEPQKINPMKTVPSNPPAVKPTTRNDGTKRQ